MEKISSGEDEQKQENNKSSLRGDQLDVLLLSTEGGKAFRPGRL